MDAYDVVGIWNKIFRMLSQIRVGKENGKIVIYNIKWKATWTVLCYILMTILCLMANNIYVYIYFGDFNVPADLFYTIITAVQVPLFVILATTESYTNINGYYKNYNLIDRGLNVTPSRYENQKKTFNNYLVIFGVLTTTTMLADILSFFIIYEVSSSIQQLPYLVSQCIIYIQYWLIILNLKIFREHLSMVLERTKEKLQATKLDRIGTTMVLPRGYLGSGFQADSKVLKDMKQLTECYMLLGDQCCLLNNKHGIQLVITFTSTAIHLTILCQIMIKQYVDIYSASGIIILTGVCVCGFVSHGSFSVGIFILNKLLRVLHETTLLVLLLRESVIVQRLRALLLSTLDRATVSSNLGPRDADSVVEFGTIIQRQTLMFTANDYFNLDYSVFHNILTALITYTVVLAQVN